MDIIKYAYSIISDFYGDRKTERSNQPLIKHIDEGMEIMSSCCAPDEAIAAYILHPMLQDNDALLNHYEQPWVYALPSSVIILLMEYRKTANSYLCRPDTDHYTVDDVPLSPLGSVNLMLYADKYQNRADFLKYHQGTHERSEQLTVYFENWLDRLAESIF